MRTIVLNGADFDTLEGFYEAIEPYLEIGGCPWGQNLDSLDEIIYYKFNFTDDIENDVIKIIWHNFEKSQAENWKHRTQSAVFGIIVAMFENAEGIEFVK